MKRAVLSILLFSLALFFGGCGKAESTKVAQPDREIEKSAKIMESQLKLSDPNFVKNATPEQMKELSETLKKE